MILGPDFMEKAHILEKYLIILNKISLLCIKWDFFPYINWARYIPGVHYHNF